ncbi:family 15 glycosyltransferase [Martensiomyces pterosporus]|nr:family 15 glycosyltransferase [Martensiomyces pterosporus]
MYHPNGTKPVRAALVALVRNTDLFGLRQAIRQVEDRFNSRFNYPYIFVNDEPFTDEFMLGVRDLTKAKVSFGTLDHESWGIPEWISREKFEHVKRTAQYPHGDKESYRLMCRFQSGYLHKHPLLRDVDFYWRIEPEVEYFCDMDYDPFVFMRDNGYKYGWNIAMTEFMDTVATLWNTTQAFISEHPEMLARENILGWLLDDHGNYNGCHFWSNFEIVDLSFYRSPQYQAFFDYLDRAGGFFYERWGDAPVHSIAAALLLNVSQIHYFDDIGYFHPNVITCPRGSGLRGKCVCDPGESFVQDGYCIVRFKESKQRVLHPESKDPVHTGLVYVAPPSFQARGPAPK